MAQVKSMLCRSSSNIFGNDAPESRFSLEICDESPPKCDFENFLKDIDLKSNSLQLDKPTLSAVGFESPQVNDTERFGPLSGNCSDLSSGTNMAPTASDVKVEACFNFNFSDLTLDENDDLSRCISTKNDSGRFGSLSGNCNFSGPSRSNNMAPTSSSVKAEPSFDFDLNFSDLTLNENDDLLKCVSTKESNDALDLPVTFADSGNSLADQPDSSVSLATLAKTHFSNSSFVGTERESNGLSALNILEHINYNAVPHFHNNVTKVKTDDLGMDLDVLNDLCSNDTEDQSCEESNRQVNMQVDYNICSENSVEDIDLSFCVKNAMKDGLLSSSPESNDSGFDEPHLPLKGQIEKNNVVKTTLHNPRPSLLSIALSCKPNSDKLKRERVLKIKRELCQNYLSRSLNKMFQNKPVMSDGIVDQSDSCVISDLIN